VSNTSGSCIWDCKSLNMVPDNDIMQNHTKSILPGEIFLSVFCEIFSIVFTSFQDFSVIAYRINRSHSKYKAIKFGNGIKFLIIKDLQNEIKHNYLHILVPSIQMYQQAWSLQIFCHQGQVSPIQNLRLLL